MPPDDADGLGDDLPGLHNDQADAESPSTDTDGLDDADLPGLDADSPSPEPDVPQQPEGDPLDRIDEAIEEWKDELEAEAEASSQWTNAELDEWFENDFGGDAKFKEEFGGSRGPTWRETYGAANDDLRFGVDAYVEIGSTEGGDAFAITTLTGAGGNRWQRLSREAKTRFRRGWGDYQASLASVTGELAPYGPDYDHPPKPTKPSLPRWIFVGGGFGILGLVLAVGFFLSGGDGDDGAVAIPSETAVEDTAPPSTAAVVEDTEAPAVAVDVPEVSAVPFPTLWSYTATKTASIVPAPEFITATPIGAQLPWAFTVSEACDGDACSYATVIDLVFPQGVVGEVPETTWVVDGAEWSLDANYQSVQSSYGDGTVCVIHNRDLFELTVTEEVIGGQSVPTAFVGTWLQASNLDLGASTGNVAFYCGEFWEVVDEWSLVGVAAG